MRAAGANQCRRAVDGDENQGTPAQPERATNWPGSTIDPYGTSLELANAQRVLDKLVQGGLGHTEEAALLEERIESLKLDPGWEELDSAPPTTVAEVLQATKETVGVKCDRSSMNMPIFALTPFDMGVVEWRTRDGETLRVIPSRKGRATLRDKDILVFCISQIVAACNKRRRRPPCRVVRFTAHAFFVATGRDTSQDEYIRLWDALERLSGTRISTDVATGGQRIKGDFGIIDSWRTVQAGRRALAVEVVISNWFYNSLPPFDVLTLDARYYRLPPLAKRVYELARMHCGSKKKPFRIHLSALREKCGSRSTLKEFKRMLRTMDARKQLPGFSLEIVNRGTLVDSLVQLQGPRTDNTVDA